MEYQATKRLHDYNLITKELEVFYHQIANSLDLSDSALDILTTILELGEGCTQTQIYKRIYLNKQTANSSVKQLLKKGIIVFKSKNGKENEIYFTEEGRVFVTKNILPLIQVDDEILSEMSEEEFSEMLFLMKKYLEILKDKLGPIYDIKKN